MHLGDNLRTMLEHYNISQKEFAKTLSITPSALGNYVQNTQEPDYNTLIRIADFFMSQLIFFLGTPKIIK